MYYKFLLIGILALFLNSCDASAGLFNKPKFKSGNGVKSVVNIDGRTYRLYKPSYLPSEKVPVLLALHGAYGNASFIEQHLGINALADKYGFMIAYPNGTEGVTMLMKNKRMWNAGNCCGVASRRNIDDVGFLTRIINDLVYNHSADPKRVFISGHSNGSMMSYRFICERPEMVTAMIGIAGPLTLNRCRNARGLKILHIHGAKDKFVPSYGGLSKKAKTGLYYKSIYENRKILEQSGANVEIKELPNTGHHLHEINQGARNNYSASLAEIIMDFIKNKQKQ